MPESYDDMRGEALNVDEHPANNHSHLPESAPDDGSQFEVAAERTRRSVKSERTPGPITKTLVSAGASPLIWGHITAGIANNLRE